ncbi:AMP-binding protein [Streptomyces sp. L2]|uniref:AMP-dependent synthetase/ligase n=1 Tax=Streptomyces sp. L2 TaxID=2162665 RepID=UPI0010101D84|nr:AMP-binding protein [Streptomyces sp. L2]
MREFSVPALPVASPAGSLTDVVFDRARTDPGRVVVTGGGEGGRDITAGVFGGAVLALAKGLLVSGVEFGDRVGIVSRNRAEWMLFDYALWTIGAQSVPLHPECGTAQAYAAFRAADVTACLVENETHAMTVAPLLARLPRLNRLWEIERGALDEIAASGTDVPDETVRRRRMALIPESVATIVQTAGTSGPARGCAITHASLMTAADALLDRCGPALTDSTQPAVFLVVNLSQLPSRVMQVAAVRAGIRVGHQPDADPDAALAGLRRCRPTFALAGRDLFERAFAAVRQEAEAEGRIGAFGMAVDVAVQYAEAAERRALGSGLGPGPGARLQHGVFQSSVHDGLRDVLGGSLRHALITGVGPQRRLGLCYSGAGLTLSETYGLAEFSGLVSANDFGRPKFATAGRPLAGTEVHVDDRGYIWVRGAQCFAGYAGDKEDADRMMSNGWLPTGDLGSLDDEGRLSITGRHDDLLVTADGTTVLPTAVEERVRAHPLVVHCVVVGDRRPHLAALITLDEAAVEHWLRLRGRRVADGRITDERDVRAEIRRAVLAANKHVPEAQRIKVFRILAERFSVHGGLLTPALAPRRRAIAQAYAPVVDELYEVAARRGR